MQLPKNSETTFFLPTHYILTITSPVGTAGSLVRQGDKAGDPDILTTTISSDSTSTFGPFNHPTRYRLINNVNSVGAISYDSVLVDLTALIEDTIAATFAGLPTEDPEVVGVPWNDEGIVTVSAGPA